MAASSKWRLVSICVIALTLQVDRVKSSAEIMKKMTLGFSKALEQCKQEMKFGDHIMQDFYNFWKEDYELLNADVGCAIMCMASKFDLINEENRLHHINAHEFAKSHGADDDMAKQLVTMIHDCENVHADIADDCKKTLEIAKCFRTKIHGLKWAPTMEVVLEEVMTEV
ncbi:general odorant-binding protein 1-like [Pectinophora gossypiella]|uniref:general odorant-binding protein 1-like n=1 Tax=Pectinophora gossypiella TaxID=13191 RepID=UPI00214EC620|nr:general odorant-binding protein 1-like [Pectinophora gossypiella]